MSKSLKASPNRSEKTEKKILRLKRYCTDKKELERFMAQYGRLRNTCAETEQSGIADSTLKRQMKLEKERIQKKMKRILKETRRIDMAIEEITDSRQALVMRYRYIDGYSWEQITEEMCYSSRTVFYLHHEAVKVLAI